ncbi:MAG: hypothetical protein JSS51_12930 [Planctomycetes bacterium]|nr:hypothetical protein [Planctomycetota bacterium]
MSRAILLNWSRKWTIAGRTPLKTEVSLNMFLSHLACKACHAIGRIMCGVAIVLSMGCAAKHHSALVGTVVFLPTVTLKNFRQDSSALWVSPNLTPPEVANDHRSLKYQIESLDCFAFVTDPHGSDLNRNRAQQILNSMLGGPEEFPSDDVQFRIPTSQSGGRVGIRPDMTSFVVRSEVVSNAISIVLWNPQSEKSVSMTVVPLGRLSDLQLDEIVQLFSIGDSSVN